MTRSNINTAVRDAIDESRRYDRIAHLELAADRDAVLEVVARVCDETGLEYDSASHITWREPASEALDIWAWSPDQPEPETTWRIEVVLAEPECDDIAR